LVFGMPNTKHLRSDQKAPSARIGTDKNCDQRPKAPWLNWGKDGPEEVKIYGPH